MCPDHQPDPTPVDRTGLSTTTCRFARVPFASRYEWERLLVVAFDGTYGYGSRGSKDATYMAAEVAFGLAAWVVTAWRRPRPSRCCVRPRRAAGPGWVPSAEGLPR